MAKTQKPARSVIRMSAIGCLIALLLIGAVLLLLHYAR